MVVRVGETIDWTLRGFQNRSGGDVTDFTIIDIPSRGLNFLGGALPVFTNSEGVTFEIRYRVYGSNEWHIYRTSIDASRPFTFTLPQPGDLFYTHIAFYFGDVPAYFGLDDEIVLTFIVGADAPDNRLVNQFWVRYDNVDREGASPDRPIVLPPDELGEPELPLLQLPSLPEMPDGVQGQTQDNGETGITNRPEDTHSLTAPPDQIGGISRNSEAAEHDTSRPARHNPQTGGHNAVTMLPVIVVAVLGALLLIGKNRMKK